MTDLAARSDRTRPGNYVPEMSPDYDGEDQWIIQR